MRPRHILLFAVAFVLSLSIAVFASDCGVVKAVYFERSQDAIMTDWIDGIPFMRLKTSFFPCAQLILRNTDWLVKRGSDLRVTGTFTDSRSMEKTPECGDREIPPGAEFSCTVCFESDPPLESVSCEFR